MLTGEGKTLLNEDSIFEELSLYKVVNTKKGKPVCLHSDGGVSIVVQFDGLNNTSFAEADFESLSKRIQSTLDDIQNSNVSIQFLMVRDNQVSDIEKYVEILPSFLQPRAKYLKELADDYKVFFNKFYLAIHCAPDKKKGSDAILDYVKKWFDKEGVKITNYEKAFSGLEARVSSILEYADLLCQMISDIGSNFRFLKTKEDYYSLFQDFTRPSKSKLEAFVVDEKSKLKDKTKKITGKIKIDDSIESPRRAIFSGVRANSNKNEFSLDGYYHKVWTLDRAPRDFIYGKSIEVIESVPCEFIYSVTFRPLSHKESIDLFKFKLAEKRILSGGDEGSIVEDRSLKAEENRISDSYDMFAFGSASGAMVSANFVMRINETVLGKMAKAAHLSVDELKIRLDQSIIKKIFSRFGFSEWVNEENTGWAVFNKIIPGMSTLHSDVLKTLFLSTENIPYFLPLYENKRNLEHNGTNHFIDSRGNAVVFDLMDPSLPAWNYSVSGQTGSGKSVLMNTLLDMQFADLAKTGKKPVICILDVGGDRGSYQKLMRLVNGTEINLSGVVKPSIQMLELVPERSNPTPGKIKSVAKVIKEQESSPLDLEDLETRVRAFYSELLDKGQNNLTEYEKQKLFSETFGFEEKQEYRDLFKLRPGECEPASKNFNLIMGILEVMLSTNAKVIDGFRTFDYDEISSIVLETYRNTPGRFPFLRDILKTAEDLFNPQDPDSIKLANRFKTKIMNWTREGAYPMFDQNTSIDVSNDVILADLKGLESNPQLQVVYTLLISQLFNDKMYFTRDRRKLIVRDEAWSIMQNERARKYFVEDLRTARKNGFATIAISQLPTDYLRPDESDGRAIITNMQVQIFCKFGTEKICKEVAAEFGLGQEVVEEMKSLGLQKELQPDGSYKTTYSKFMMIMGGKSIYVFYNILHPFEYILYSSSAEDNAIIDFYMRIKKSHDSLEAVLWLIAENRHIGDRELADFLEKGGYTNMARRVKGGK
jgi:type IV secretory pathway VirB4 component